MSHGRHCPASNSSSGSSCGSQCINWRGGWAYKTPALSQRVLLGQHQSSCMRQCRVTVPIGLEGDDDDDDDDDCHLDRCTPKLSLANNISSNCKWSTTRDWGPTICSWLQAARVHQVACTAVCHPAQRSGQHTQALRVGLGPQHIPLGAGKNQRHACSAGRSPHQQSMPAAGPAAVFVVGQGPLSCLVGRP